MPLAAPTERNPRRNPGEGPDGWRERTAKRSGASTAVLAYRYCYTPFAGAASVKRGVELTR